MQIRFLRSLFVHESWVNGKIVQELHSESFHPRFLGSKRAPAWALTFLWLARATSELCHRNNQTYYSEPTPEGGKRSLQKRSKFEAPLLIKGESAELGEGNKREGSISSSPI